MPPWLTLSICMILPVLAIAELGIGLDLWTLAWIAGSSLLGYVLIADDKQRAKHGDRRTPESTLHLVELLGGWPGSYLAQQRHRHKTVKVGYRVTFWLIVLSHQGIAIDALRGWPIWQALH
ncbi:MAG: DUF1294 domain-containing protein [Acidobacteriota bacterium]